MTKTTTRKTTNKKLDKYNEMYAAAYTDFAAHVNAMSESKLITHDEYSQLFNSFENRHRDAAAKRALYKVGDRITLPGCYYQVVEVTEIRVYEADFGGPMSIFYRGRKLDRYGNYTKIQPNGFGIRESRAVPFVPAQPKTK